MNPILDVLGDIAVFVAVILVSMAVGGLMLFGAAYFIDCFQDSKKHKKGE